jgi:hypothetical protein
LQASLLIGRQGNAFEQFPAGTTSPH